MSHESFFLCSDSAQRKWGWGIGTLASGFGGKICLTFDRIIWIGCWDECPFKTLVGVMRTSILDGSM